MQRSDTTAAVFTFLTVALWAGVLPAALLRAEAGGFRLSWRPLPLVVVGGLLLLGEAVSAWIERLRFGSGLMFADAEVFLVLGLAVGATGAAALWAGLRLMGLLGDTKTD